MRARGGRGFRRRRKIAFFGWIWRSGDAQEYYFDARRPELKTKLKKSLIQPRTSQTKFSLFENVSFLVNPKIGGISERAHMRRRSAGPPWCGVVAIIVSFLILKMFIFGEPQYRGYFRESSYEGAVWRTPFVQSSSNNRFVPSLKIFIFGLISTRT